MSSTTPTFHAAIPKPRIFSLSDNASVEAILTDIPFFSVGLLAFGISTFLLVMRRVSLVSVYLHLSALAGFSAAVLDLSQVLAVDRDSKSAVTGLVNAREVTFAISFGLRFLFYWTLVSIPFGDEEPPSEAVDTKSSVARPYRDYIHSASWHRWGYLGFILKWGILALSISVPVLQGIWRIAQRRFDIIYMIESTIEIVLSALFILKILLNIFLSPVVPLQNVVRAYIAPVLALLISLGVGIGNLLSFLFSENSLGRLLQAVEIYILILFILISTFQDFFHTSEGRSRRRMKGTSSFYGLGTKQDFFVEPPTAEERKSNDTGPMGNAISSDQGVVRTRQSTTYRISSWMQQRTRSFRPFSADQRSRESDLENGQAVTVIPNPPATTMDISPDNIPQRAPSLDKSSEVVADEKRDDDTQIPQQKLNFLSLGSDYVPARESRTESLSYPSAPFASQGARYGADSPVYGLNGIMASAQQNDGDMTPRPANSMSSFDELLRQQTELDKSIAALRLFSSETSEQSRAPSPKPPKAIVKTQSIASTAQNMDTASNRSEFSLSIFPEPPELDDTRNSVNFASILQASRTTLTGKFTTSKPRLEEFPTVPSSPGSPETRLNSGGTQYEITSFIGDLTGPLEQSPFPRDIESMTFDGLSVTTPAPGQGSLAPSTSPPVVRPFLNSAPQPPVAIVPLRPPITMPAGPRGQTPVRSRSMSNGSKPQAGIRTNISGPRQLSGKEELGPNAFERPRRPPQLTLDSDIV